MGRRRGALSAVTSLQATPPTSPDNPIYSLSQGGFYGGGGQLGACMCLAFATIAWVLAIMFPTFVVLKMLGMLRERVATASERVAVLDGVEIWRHSLRRE